MKSRLGLFLVFAWLIGGFAAADAAAQSRTGYRDFSFGTTCNSTPTGEKPESKLWFNDGLWWGSLCNPTAQAYRIYRLDLSTQQWVDTGTQLDDRPGTKADTLWDSTSQKLYVVSHVFTTGGQAVSSSAQWGRLYRLSYNSSTKRYTLDTGFPVTVTRGKSETLVVAKDSSGQLWVTYVESGKVMINHSVGADTTWRDPYALPLSSTATTVTSDDISAVLAFQDDKIGVMWSNQTQKKFFFAVHLDGAVDTAWQMDSVGIPGPPCSTDCGDDHINLKSIQVDSSGRVFAAIKTSVTAASAPLVMLAVRDNAGNWASYAFGRKLDHHTRPIVLLDEEGGRLYMFATAPESSGSIYYKSTDLDNISFPVGLGDLFIDSSTDSRINNATSTKQNLSSSTGLVVLASDQDSHYYLHNYLPLQPVGGPVADFSASPVTGTAPLTVAFTDLSTGSPTSWSWNFGDGGTSTQQNPSHSYSTAGQYTVSLTASNSAGPNTKTRTNYITVSAGTQTPTADFSGAPVSGQAPLSVTFTDLSTGSPTSWSWNFGDGGTSTQQNPSHSYSTAGQYTVSLTASNSAGPNTKTRTNYITVSAGTQTPTADFSGAPISGQAPLAVTFTDLSTGSPTSWSWNFGDGGTSTQQNPSHSYSTAGQYTVSLTASNSAGTNTGTKTNYITVSAAPQPPGADFSGSPTAGSAPLTVNFTDLSSGTPTSWSWSFGDGGTSTAQNPTHIYNAAGQYTVSLTAANPAGNNTVTKTNYVTVSSSTTSVSHAETRTGGSSGLNQVSTASALTGVAGNLYLAAVSTKPASAVVGMSGMGLSWTRVANQCAGRGQTGVELWMALGNPASNGAVTASLGSAPLNAAIAVSRYSGVNASLPLGNEVSGNTNGANGLCSGGIDSSSYSFNLPSPTTGAVIYGVAAIRNRTHTPGSGYAERAEIAQGLSGDTAALAVEDKPASSTTVVNGSLSGTTDWAVVAVEIKPQ